MTVALVVPVVPPPEDVVVVDEDELDPEEDCDDENEELDEFDDELEDEDEMETEPGLPGAPETLTDPGLPAAPNDERPRENEPCLIVFNTPCRQRIAADCPEENPEIETRGSSRHARWPIEIRSGPSAEIFPVASCVVGRVPLAPATPVETNIATIATTSPRRIASKCAHLRASCQRDSRPRAMPRRDLRPLSQTFSLLRGISRGRRASAVVSGGGGSRTRGGIPPTRLATSAPEDCGAVCCVNRARVHARRAGD